jgi:ComF family protein
MDPLTGAVFPFAFAEGAREAVHLLKYAAKRRLAEPMAEQMARMYWTAPSLRQSDLIVPVGLHPKRQAKRGYNQSEWLSAELGILLGLPVRCWSSRERDTRPQVGLSRHDRAANVAKAFSAAPEATGHHILLVDDVSTTGATAREAARALRKAGAASVGLLTFARDV